MAVNSNSTSSNEILSNKNATHRRLRVKYTLSHIFLSSLCLILINFVTSKRETFQRKAIRCSSDRSPHWILGRIRMWWEELVSFYSAPTCLSGITPLNRNEIGNLVENPALKLIV